MEGLRRSRGGFERGRIGGGDLWSKGGRRRQSCGVRCETVRYRGVERWRIGLLVHLRRPG